MKAPAGWLTVRASDCAGREQQRHKKHSHTHINTLSLSPSLSPLSDSRRRAKTKGRLSCLFSLLSRLAILGGGGKKLVEQTGRSKRGEEGEEEGRGGSSSGEGRQNDMRSTDGERGGGAMEEGKRGN